MNLLSLLSLSDCRRRQGYLVDHNKLGPWFQTCAIFLPILNEKSIFFFWPAPCALLCVCVCVCVVCRWNQSTAQIRQRHLYPTPESTHTICICNLIFGPQHQMSARPTSLSSFSRIPDSMPPSTLQPLQKDWAASLHNSTPSHPARAPRTCTLPPVNLNCKASLALTYSTCLHPLTFIFLFPPPFCSAKFID
jgi:hypothetical protein